jgi:folate-dependent phosphoribosylglycinamide formyltransferase PurN
MKIVLWIGSGANQKALANKIQAKFPLAGIVRETPNNTINVSFSKIVEKIIERIFLSKISKSWNFMQTFYQKKYPGGSDSKLLDVENINSDFAFDFTKELNPDLILVSGTRLIKGKMLSINPSIGILNLHTGLSPYIKGGPNCTNWCISTKQFHLIGNTIMWLDAGIDSGNILRTDFTSFDGTETLSDVHLKVMQHAHDLYIKAIEDVFNNTCSNVKQSDIAIGKLYYNRSWGLKQKINLIRNMPAFRKAVKSGETTKKQKSIVVIKASEEN